MDQRGVSYQEIWKVIHELFPHYVHTKVMDGSDDYSILCRANPFEYLNLNPFLRTIVYNLEKENIYSYEELEKKLKTLISELHKYQNWRTESLIKYFHNSLLKKIRVEVPYIQKYVVNMHIIYSEDVFKVNAYQTYNFIKTPPLDYCDLNMFFLTYFPELLSEYRQFALKYHGDDTDSSFLYSTLLEDYLLKNIDDEIIYTKILDFFKKITELPDIKEGISPTGIIFGNGSGVISHLKDVGIIIPNDFSTRT